MAFNRKQKLRDNIEAVRTAFTLDRERRTPTERERALLERYCGFGGLKCILNPARELSDAVHWAKSDLELFAPTVELHRIIRENSRDETEYKRYVDSLKASVLTAFYTPQAITDTIADVLHDRKVRPKLVLEPSAGMGAFIGSVLSDNPQAEVMAFEKDLLTGKMLGYLYPEQKIRTEGFEKIEKPFLNRFDLVISNIPFGDIAVFDPTFADGKDKIRGIASKTIHNYFFLKALDAVKDGGIVTFITSQGCHGQPEHGGTWGNDGECRPAFRHPSAKQPVHGQRKHGSGQRPDYPAKARRQDRGNNGRSPLHCWPIGRGKRTGNQQLL